MTKPLDMTSEELLAKLRESVAEVQAALESGNLGEVKRGLCAAAENNDALMGRRAFNAAKPIVLSKEEPLPQLR